MIHGVERVVVRYDTCHGHLHLHRYWIGGGLARDLEDPRSPMRSYAARLDAAEKDLRQNWQGYRAKIELERN